MLALMLCYYSMTFYTSEDDMTVSAMWPHRMSYLSLLVYRGTFFCHFDSI